MSSDVQQLNQAITELQKFANNTRRQTQSEGNQNYRKGTLEQYYNILNASSQQLAQ